MSKLNENKPDTRKQLSYSQESSFSLMVLVTVLFFKTMTFDADKGYFHMVHTLYKIKIGPVRTETFFMASRLYYF